MQPRRRMLHSFRIFFSPLAICVHECFPIYYCIIIGSMSEPLGVRWVLMCLKRIRIDFVLIDTGENGNNIILSLEMPFITSQRSQQCTMPSKNRPPFLFLKNSSLLFFSSTTIMAVFQGSESSEFPSISVYE